jgi:outer membrane protein OmpA-like peptidoglycan-associated protein
VVLGGSLFETNGAEMRRGTERALDSLVRALDDDPNATVEIDGHTDATGDRDFDAQLSLNRAQAIEAYLVAQGIASERMTAAGLGADYPIASNETESGRQHNRRVEVQIRIARQ